MFCLRVVYDCDGPFCGVFWFSTEREARQVLNLCANGRTLFTLCGPDAAVIVESAFPVLMVA